MASCRFCPDKPTRICPFCKQCLNHIGCKCIRCNKCEKKQPKSAICVKCTQCIEHHIEGSYVGDEFPLRRCEFAPRPVTTFAINNLHRLLGVEVEVGELGTFSTRGPMMIPNLTYLIEHDGSVRPSGIELIVQPNWGDKFCKGMISFLKVLTASGCQMNETCGYHVHVDAADLSMRELRKLVVMFRSLQGEIFGTLVNKNRASNHYCRPLDMSTGELQRLLSLTTKETKEWFHNELYGESIKPGMTPSQARTLIARLKQKKSHKYENDARRWALNFHSYMMRGTVEFRCKEGNLNPDDFLLWPLFCGNFVQASVKLTDKEMSEWVTGNHPSLKEFSDRFMPQMVQDWVNKLCK